MIEVDDLTAELVAGGCGDWETIEETMTLVRYGAMQRFWLQHPPVHVMVAAYLGYKPPAFSTPKPSNSNLGDLIAMFAGTGGKI